MAMKEKPLCAGEVLVSDMGLGREGMEGRGEEVQGEGRGDAMGLGTGISTGLEEEEGG